MLFRGDGEEGQPSSSVCVVPSHQVYQANLIQPPCPSHSPKTNHFTQETNQLSQLKTGQTNPEAAYHKFPNVAANTLTAGENQQLVQGNGTTGRLTQTTLETNLQTPSLGVGNNQHKTHNLTHGERIQPLHSPIHRGKRRG